jgi:hypothetical protein
MIMIKAAVKGLLDSKDELLQMSAKRNWTQILVLGSQEAIGRR